MRILMTGASSFTGYWFAKQLTENGHEVVATFTRPKADEYDGEPRAHRVASLLGFVEPRFGVRFGDERFASAIEDEHYDAVCAHGADVTEYKSPDFDICRAVANNTLGLTRVLRATAEKGMRVVLTGSVFEGGEGAGSEGLPHFSPYGMSKAFTAELFRHYSRREGADLGKFVIPNPFGPLEEPRFTNYLIKTWRAEETAGVRTPLYVRDNVPVSLLAAAYARFVTNPPANGYTHCSPSGYAEAQGAFAERFAREMRPRLGLPCELELASQTEFAEPRVRVNTEPLNGADFGWDESRAWDEVAEFYESVPSMV
ncbi:NAD dependent epimerase/dehydratase family protein [Pseudobythopirellula maris]|uniref:NAD dependent epimerase/dehydratase family protein n=1 Tax=Pseudobythopirellula maris TaxID=2527991 RepID=A0A5C5ZKE0_9BACT|nr:NAD(P)-dependent oxidoreductase [Pseudobythopirellula maris]TWT87507.1 NAD dependent epimerase/dehydratase family protein [Pseudobythopirellula maris]